MSDFKIINFINGGARIAEYHSGFMSQCPFRVFEVDKEQYDLIKTVIYKDVGEP